MIGGHLLPTCEADFTQPPAGFVRTMQRAGVPIFALTLQNEPGYQQRSYPGIWRTWQVSDQSTGLQAG